VIKGIVSVTNKLIEIMKNEGYVFELFGVKVVHFVADLSINYTRTGKFSHQSTVKIPKVHSSSHLYDESHLQMIPKSNPIQPSHYLSQHLENNHINSM